MTAHPLFGPPHRLLRSHLESAITAFTEVRQRWFALQPDSLATYHSFTVLEVAEGWRGGKLFISMEKHDSWLDLMIGRGADVHSFVKEFRANGIPRTATDKHYEMPRQELSPGVTVSQLLDWIN